MARNVGQCVLVSHSGAGVNDCETSFAVKGLVRGAGRQVYIYPREQRQLPGVHSAHFFRFRSYPQALRKNPGAHLAVTLCRPGLGSVGFSSISELQA